MWVTKVLCVALVPDVSVRLIFWTPNYIKVKKNLIKDRIFFVVLQINIKETIKTVYHD